jgi:hypothetical protein
MIEAVTWEQVQKQWEENHKASINYYVERINGLLRDRSNRCPGGHWMFDTMVPVHLRKEVGEVFAKAGWKVHADDRNFTLNVPDALPKDGPYR